MDDYIYRLCSFLGNRLPLPILYFLGNISARIKYIFVYSVRKTVRENVRIVLEYRKEKRGLNYTEAELTHIVKETYYNFSRYLADFFNVPKWDVSRVKEKVKIENISLLDEGLSKGKGVVALTAHTGNWELSGVVASILGYNITAIAIPYLSPAVTKIYKDRRNSKGVEVLLTGSSPKGPLKALKENRILAVLGDKTFTEKGIKTDFLGVKSLVPRGPATLVAKTGAFFTAGFFIMEKNGYRFFFKRIEMPPDSMTDEEKINFLFTRSIKVIEDVILDYPSQWLNFSPFKI
jgi:KDO2-lipid IV(A) lauroyltransferase